ncbi:MAG: putative ATP-dependent RNA helicase dhr2 [Sclerophora amabilis]|nr:MAG: putative ATP-dependent RNA helicase dhr2 [Sclerophora amabilis]
MRERASSTSQDTVDSWNDGSLGGVSGSYPSSKKRKRNFPRDPRSTGKDSSGLQRLAKLVNSQAILGKRDRQETSEERCPSRRDTQRSSEKLLPTDSKSARNIEEFPQDPASSKRGMRTGKNGRSSSQSNGKPLVTNGNGQPRNLHEGSEVQSGCLNVKSTYRGKKLLASRKALPVWGHHDQIKLSLKGNDVLLIGGETGSGKSTQVPQFLVDEPWCQSRTVNCRGLTGNGQQKSLKVGGCVAVTEPRRVAAISLARRVASEMGSPLGSASPASKVGYSVRFDNSTSPCTRIKFVTEGMLLQELLRDPWLRQYSAVVVDEIHERGVNVDLVVGFLRQILSSNKEGRGGVPLKVIVMSATADMDQLRRFFSDVPETNELLRYPHHSPQRIEDPGKDESGKDSCSSESSWSGFSNVNTEDGNPESRPIKSNPQSAEVQKGTGKLEDTPKVVTTIATTTQNHSSDVGICLIEGRQFPVQVFYEPNPVGDIIDASLRTIFQIHHDEPMPGDILVFLTGQEEIEALEKLINDKAAELEQNLPQIVVLPLFAALPQNVQQKVFEPASTRNTRKIILSTNIAETSVTVPGVRHVIDGGKAKIKHFRTRLGLDSLLAKPISKSSAIQRRGRAGREAPGKCYRLYTEQAYSTFDRATGPEILRCDLAQIVLMIKARWVTDIMSFPFLTSPIREALEKALLQLHTLNALTQDGHINAIGRQMAKFPLNPHLSRVLLAAAEPETDCLLEVIDIISCLTVENVFLNLSSEEQKEEAELARKELLRREGDHLTLLNTVQKYVRENTDRKSWSTRHFVSHRAMQAVMDVRKQLRAYCMQEKLLAGEAEIPSTLDVSPQRTAIILRCFLKGFASKTARLSPDGSYRTMIGNHGIAIHPSSGMFGRRLEAIMYDEYLFTNKSYAKCVSAVQLDWVGEALRV